VPTEPRISTRALTKVEEIPPRASTRVFDRAGIDTELDTGACPLLSNVTVAVISASDGLAIAIAEAMLSSFYNAWRIMAAIYLFAGIVMLVLFRKPTDEQMAAANEVTFVD
jgi:hypothetical protein